MSKIPDAKLLIVGTEQLKNNLKNMANELEVSKIIEFKGFVKAYRGVEKILVKLSSSSNASEFSTALLSFS